MQQRKNIKLIQLIDQKTGQTQPYILQLDLVGKGFYGSVYKAVHQHNPNKVYAVKVITLKRQQTRQQILKQLQIIQKIPKSPNLVDTHKQHLQSKKHLYIFQQFCQGGNLAEFKQRMQGKLMKEQVAFDMFYQLCRGYIDLYQAGIIHEDIKPSNILIKGKLYKYCDFGGSQFANNLKYEQSRKGTVSYMAPQKLLSNFKPGARSDIFSLGVTLYEVIFGFHPYLKKKTKNTKQYLMTLRNAQLAASHQLLRRIYNPSLRFSKLINLIQGMICRKAQLRMSIQELKDVILNQEPFRGMGLYIYQNGNSNKSQVIHYSNESPTNNTQISNNNNINRNYTNINITPYINQSKVFVIPTPKKTNLSLQQQQNLSEQYQQQQNRLFPTPIIQLPPSSTQCKQRAQQSIRISKIIKQQQNNTLEQLFNEYHCIQQVINYLNSGIKKLQQVFNQVQQNKQCSGNYFIEHPFTIEYQHLIYHQSPCHILHFMILKLNLQLMTSFSKSITDMQRFYNQVSIWQQVQYLQAQLSKFIADNNNNIKQIQLKRGLINGLCKEIGGVRGYCDVLGRQFRRVFQNMVRGNSVRVNFKEDLLNGVWLLRVKEILQMVQQLPCVDKCGQQFNINNTSYNKHMSLNSLIQQIQLTTNQYNEYKQFRRDQLKQSFYKQFQNQQGIIYDIQQNDDQFITLDQLIQSDQQEERNMSLMDSEMFQELDSIDG